MVGSAGFVGRERELSRLRTGLGGEARLVLVVGDAGVGKTRFVSEGVRQAAAGGMVCLLGGCLPLAEKLPLLPVAEALGELSRLDGGRIFAAALEAGPPFVRVELERLLPQLAPGGRSAAVRGEEWRRERLFAAVAELLAVVAGGSRVGLVIEDVQWADSATLDCLTFLARARADSGVTVVTTCRTDEAILDRHVTDWLEHVRAGAVVEEIQLRPLSREEVAGQIAALVSQPPPAGLVDELYARGEGNPFFTEQLVAAAVADTRGGGLSARPALPTRLAELLVARVGRCSGDARDVLAALAVAGRPLTEALLSAISGLDMDTVGHGLQELAAARLLADTMPDEAYRPRHALLAEALAARLLPSERVSLHERTARALQAASGMAVAAEVAGHWAAAGRTAEELPARVAAAEAAEGVFAYAEAAAHWQRAIGLCQITPSGIAQAAGVDLPGLYVRAIDTADMSGDGERSRELAEEAYQRFGDHPDHAVAAVACERAAYFRGYDAVFLGRISGPDAGLALMERGLELFEKAPSSAAKAEAWFHYQGIFMFHAQGRIEPGFAAASRALKIAEEAGADALIPRYLSVLARYPAFRGQLEEGFAILRRGRALAEASGNGAALLWMAGNESAALLGTGQFERAAEVALRGFRAAHQTGLDAWSDSVVANACEALLALGRTADAAALIGPLTSGPPDRGHWVVHQCRAEIDLLRGDIEAATQRQQQINPITSRIRSLDVATEEAQRAAELALWAGRPGDALQEVNRLLGLFEVPDLTILCGRLLAAGMRACADMADRARARRDSLAVDAALAAAGELTSWVGRMGGTPLTDHPYQATIPAWRATWGAERSRLAGASDPTAWQVAATSWEDLGCPHRAGYAWWRNAEALLATGQHIAAATAPAQAAAAAAQGHAPLLTKIRTLAQRARIPLHEPFVPSPDARRAADTAAPYGLTDGELATYGLTGRELAVLRLVAAGRTNAQIGAELFISPRTAGVHVTNILRKLGVANRVQAAALAERAGLIPSPQG